MINGQSIHTGDLDSRLARLAAERDIALAQLIEAACDRGIGTLVQFGSLGRGAGDAFSDLDLIATPILAHTRGDICAAAFDDRILATITVPRNAPFGGAYRAVCIETTDAALWIDSYLWPIATMRIPADTKVVFDHIGLPHDPRSCAELLAAHTDRTQPAHPATGATTLLRVSVAAKYYARGDHTRMAAKLPQTCGLPADSVPGRLHEVLTTITEPELDAAVVATRRLVDLAATHATRAAAERNRP